MSSTSIIIRVDDATNNHCTSIIHQIARTNLYHHVQLANGCGHPHLKSIGHGLAASWNGKLAT
jgi:hypothetical protein